MEEEEDIPPFWLHPTEGRRRSFRRQASSIFLNSGVILVTLLVLAFVFIYIIVPSFVSFTSQLFKPNLIRKSWDSLNLVLVLFAVVCGFLSRNHSNSNNNGSPSYRSISNSNVAQRSYPSTPVNRWNRDRTAYNSLNRLRSFNSYPDLRHESLWMSNDEPWRFYDDTHLNGYRIGSDSDQLQDKQQEVKSNDERWRFYDDTRYNGYRISSDSDQRQDFPPPSPLRKQEEVKSNDERWRFYDDSHRANSNSDQMQDVLPPPQEEEEVKKIEQEEVSVEDVDADTSVKEVVYTPPPSPPPPADSPPHPRRSTPKPPAKVVRRKAKRTYEHEKTKVETDFEVNNFNEPPLSPPSPPPQPPQPAPVLRKSEKKRGKDLLTSFRKRKKKERQKSVENLESLFDPQSPFYQSSIPPPSPAPPPPPPPPPPHFFQNLFSTKKSRAKKPHPAPPPHRPAPSSSRSSRTSESEASRTTVQVAAAVTTHEPPKSVRTGGFISLESSIESGNQSPLNPIPPPPPLPPFKLSSWKFVRDGDYVRVASFGSSRSGSPDLEGEESSEKESSPMAETTKLMPFCPSPDVDTKAENFIARFRAGLKLEKVNSVKGRSNLGPGPGEGPT